MASTSVGRIPTRSQDAPLRYIETTGQGREEGFESRLTGPEEKTFAISLTWEGYATLDVESLRRVISRHWSLMTRNAPTRPHDVEIDAAE